MGFHKLQGSHIRYERGAGGLPPVPHRTVRQNGLPPTQFQVQIVQTRLVETGVLCPARRGDRP